MEIIVIIITSKTGSETDWVNSLLASLFDVNILGDTSSAVSLRGGVLEDRPQPRGQLDDKKSRPWPWPRRPVALALHTAGLGLEALSSETWLQSLLISVPKLR